ncbi:MAG: serine hydrolase [Candidatus Lokiarchaeota archaeon]|nr:serine hydrolase [Candidatus Lokiarchaeota archaeon]
MKGILKKVYVIFFISYFVFFTSWFPGLSFFNNSNKVELNDNVKLQAQAPDYWPTTGWRASSPESQGVSPQKLQEMEDYIVSENIGGYIDSLLIVRNGYLVYESYPSHIYDANIRHHIFSCTKVFTSTLIGVALEEGYISGLDDYVLDYFPNRTFDNMDYRKEAITIKDLLTMTSGIAWTDQVDYYQMAFSYNWVQYVLDQPMVHQPGEVWNYNTGGSHLLSAILDRETPNGTLDYAKTRIFDPLNITEYSWNLDRQGIPIGGTLLHLTPRDMAKFGFLYLNNGTWNGTQLIPASWVAEATTSFIDVEFDQSHGSGYGYQWWIYNWLNAYTARGSNQQYIVVIPDLNLVVVSTGNTEYQFIRLLVDFILPSAGFTPLNLVFVISLIVGTISLSILLGFTFFHFKKKRTIKKLRKEFFEETDSNGETFQ